MTELADVTAAAEAYAASRYDQGKADQHAVDQPTIDALAEQVSTLDAELTDAEAAIDKVQSAFDSYKASHPDPKPVARFPGDPGAGQMYVGESVFGGDPSAHEKLWGSVVGAFRSYVSSANAQASVAMCKRDLDAGRLPFHSSKVPGTWADVAAGKSDASWLRPLLDGLGALPGPVWLCLHHEPYDNTKDAKGVPIPGMQVADFTAMNRHVMSLLPKNVALVPILQSAPFDPTVGGSQNIAAWYPPGSYTFVGLDTYNHRYYVPAPGNKYRDPATVLSVVAKVRNDLGLPDVPIAVAEFGTRTDPANPGKAAQWLRDFVAQARILNIPAVCYFDSGLNVNDHGTPWSLDDKTDGTDGLERVTAYGPLVAAGAHLGRS